MTEDVRAVLGMPPKDAPADEPESGSAVVAWTCTGCGAELPAYATHCPGSALVPRLAAGGPLTSVLNDTSDGHLKNTGMAANAYEVRATDPSESGKEVTGGHGTNTGGFELRVSQEQGTH
jgi:hypothetical protein